MSAVSSYGVRGDELDGAFGLSEPGRVIDLNAERRRRRIYEADLERAILAHPAGSARAALTAPVTYRFQVPLYAKVAGWILAFALVIAVGMAAGSLLRAEPYSGPTHTHTVASGESLWGLAQGVGSVRPLEDVVEDIRGLNGLSDATLHPGQQVVLPLD